MPATKMFTKKEIMKIKKKKEYIEIFVIRSKILDTNKCYSYKEC